MARGPKKHLKRLRAPKHWMLDKLGGTWAPRPSTGPHKLRECLPLVILLRNRLKYALTRRECLMICMNRNIQVDGKVRTDLNYPAGFMDVITIKKTNEQFRLLYDTKGRFVLHEVKEDEASFKLCRIKKQSRGKPSTMGRNPLVGHNVNFKGRQASVPYVVTHDGRTIRYPNPKVNVHDTVKVNLATGKIEDYVKFKIGNIAMVTSGHNTGRIGIITHRDRHPGSFDIVHVTDKTGSQFATRIQNVFVIGDGDSGDWVSLPKGLGVRYSITEERDKRNKKLAEQRRRQIE
eukprot:TRINITY_DN4608_c0_g2_i1.p1 TRINITY_DN4608_c0_g2~~TRINITY_DN4608_c0_g2_i1.p1  ORF type:complete len:327 (+),score=90.81 TRINITY_DN4608_c0_g2_i1:114-983(+)